MKTQKIHYAWVVMISCCFIMIGTLGIIANCMSVFLAQINADTGISMTALSLYFTFLTATMALFQPVASKLFEKFDARIIASFAVIITAIGMGLMSLYNGAIGFYISGIINGIGLSFLTFLLIPTLMNKWFVVKIGLVMGIAMACTNVGGAIFSPIAGKLIASMGWREAIVVMALISAVISLPFAIFGIRREPSEKGLEAYGIGNITSNAGSKPALQGFTLKESAKTAWLWLIFLGVIAVYFASNFQTQIVKFATTVGFPIEKASIVASMLMIGGICGKVGLGFINDRFGLIPCTIFGGVCGVTGLVLLITCGGTVALVFIGALLFGISFSMMSIIPPLWVRKALGPKFFGIIFGFVASVGTVTSALASPIYGAIYDSTGTYYIGLIIALVCFALTAVLTAIIVGGTRKLWKADK